MATIEGLCNQAIDMVGYKKHIGTIWEGSRAARVLLNNFAETRDEILRTQLWPFATQHFQLIASLALPQFPWTNRWDYPTTVIKVYDVYDRNTNTLPTTEVVPSRWALSGSTTPRSIQTNFPTATAVCTLRFIRVEEYPADFNGMLVAALADKLRMLVAQEGDGGKRNDSQQRT